MTLEELKQIVDTHYEMNEHNRSLKVCIVNKSEEKTFGGTPSTAVISAVQGIDWDYGVFFLVPETPMVEVKE